MLSLHCCIHGAASPLVAVCYVLTELLYDVFDGADFVKRDHCTALRAMQHPSMTPTSLLGWQLTLCGSLKSRAYVALATGYGMS